MPNDQKRNGRFTMPNEESINPNVPEKKVTTRQYDLEERTALFGEEIIRFARKIPENTVAKPIITQLSKSGTSMGANYCEADDAESKKDFVHKIGICKKEARETKYWLRLIGNTLPELKDEARVLWKETHELILIFGAIIRSSQNKN